MNRFVKDNMVLFIIMGSTVLGALILLTFAVLGHARMYSYYSEAEQLRSQIEELIKQKPAPVQGNEAPIREETQFYKQKTAELLPRFGQIKGDALNAFIYTLLMKKIDPAQKNQKIAADEWKTKADRRKLEENKQKFLETFRAAWAADEDRKAQGGRQRFYQSFARGRTPEHNWAADLKLTEAQREEQWKLAMAAFREEYQKLTVEIVDENNQDDILMSVLGVPRNFSGNSEQCLQFFMVPMLARVQELCANPPPKPGEKAPVKTPAPNKDEKNDKDAAANKMELLNDAPYFGFKNIYVPRDRNNPAASMPPEQIADVVKNWEVIGNLVLRMLNEGITSLNSFTIRNLAGEKVGRYVVYHYTFSVTGEIARIRALAQNLNAAAKENRMYIIRSIFLYADRDGAQEIFLERQQAVLEKRQELESGKENQQQQEGAPTEPDQPRSRRRRGAAMDMPPDPMMGGEQPVEKVKTPAQIRAEEMKKPYYKRMGYGRTLFGGSQNCEAVFDVEYVYLAEPELD